MQKRSLGICGIGLLSMFHGAMAGSVGPETYQRPSLIPFIGLEGLWTIMDMNFTSTHPRPNTRTEPWGGRLSAGLILPRSNALNYTLETSWGYYGNLSIRSHSTRASIDGADLLVGVMYKPQKYGVFFKAGTLFENTYINFNTSKTTITNITGEPLNVTTNMQGEWEQSYILPKIRVGGVYQTGRLGVSFAYDLAFGTLNPYFKSHSYTNGNNITFNGDFNIKAVTLNSFLLGLYYELG